MATETILGLPIEVIIPIIAAITGKMTSKGKPRMLSLAIVYLKNESLKNINQQEILGEFLFLYGSNVFPRNP